MDKKKLEYFKKRLESRQVELRRMVTRTEQDGRTVDEGSAQDMRTARLVLTPRNFSFIKATTTANFCKWWMELWSDCARVNLENVSPAARRLMRNVLRQCLGPDIASNARRSWNRESWRRLRARSQYFVLIRCRRPDRRHSLLMRLGLGHSCGAKLPGSGQSGCIMSAGRVFPHRVRLKEVTPQPKSCGREVRARRNSSSA